MESTSAAPQALPPQAVIMQMVMGGWIARAVSEISRLNIPDVLKKQGPMSAAELVASGIDANTHSGQVVTFHFSFLEPTSGELMFRLFPNAA